MLGSKEEFAGSGNIIRKAIRVSAGRMGRGGAFEVGHCPSDCAGATALAQGAGLHHSYQNESLRTKLAFALKQSFGERSRGGQMMAWFITLYDSMIWKNGGD
jgi:hypothetical protein